MHNGNKGCLGFDWEEIISGHSDWGSRARQSGIKDIFTGLTENQIKARVQAAWKESELIRSQYDVDGISRQFYRGVDPVSNQIVEFWFNPRTKIVETAWPKGFLE